MFKHYYYVHYILESNQVNGNKMRNGGWLIVSCYFWQKWQLMKKVSTHIDERIELVGKKNNMSFIIESLNINKM